LTGDTGCTATASTYLRTARSTAIRTFADGARFPTNTCGQIVKLSARSA